MDCEACREPIEESPSLNCAGCNLAFHPLCANINEEAFQNWTAEAKSSWVCPKCHRKIPKGNNANTPVRCFTPGGPPHPNVTTTRGSNRNSNPDGAANTEALYTLTNEIRMMREDMNKLSQSMKSISTQLTQCIDRLDSYEEKILALEEREGERELEVTSLRSTVLMLQEQADTQQQWNMRNEIEIMGINETPNENLTHVVLVTAQKIGFTLHETEIDEVHRVGPKRPAKSNGIEASENMQPRPVILRLTRKPRRDAFLRSAKSRRNLSTADVEVSGPHRKLFFNERLTKKNRQFFREARLRAKHHGFRFCWIKNGSVYVREKEGAQAVAIKHPGDLDARIGLAPASEPTVATCA